MLSEPPQRYQLTVCPFAAVSTLSQLLISNSPDADCAGAGASPDEGEHAASTRVNRANKNTIRFIFLLPLYLDFGFARRYFR